VMHLAIHPIRKVAPVAAVEEGADLSGVSTYGTKLAI
jgi:hypothetical protein